MSSRPQINLGIVGHDGVSPVFKKIGREAGGLKGMLKLAFATGPLAGGLTSITHDVTDFAKESVTKFGEVGRDVLKLQRIIGGTPEDVSKLRFAFHEMGMGVDEAKMSLKKFSTQAISKKGLSEIGVNAKDAHGRLKPFNQLLFETADRFQKMPNGILKTAMATKLFGRTGLQMLPFLNQGSKGIEKFMEEAKGFGQVLSGEDLKAVMENTMATREFHAAMEGLQMQIGRYLLPVVTAITKKVVEWGQKAIELAGPALGKLKDIVVTLVGKLGELWQWVTENKAVFITLAAVIGTVWGLWKAYTLTVAAYNGVIALATAATTAWTAAQAALNIALDANPIGLIVLAVAGLIAGAIALYNNFKPFHDLVDSIGAAFGRFVDAVMNSPLGAFFGLIAKVLGVIGDTFFGGGAKTPLTAPQYGAPIGSGAATYGKGSHATTGIIVQNKVVIGKDISSKISTDIGMTARSVNASRTSGRTTH